MAQRIQTIAENLIPGDSFRIVGYNSIARRGFWYDVKSVEVEATTPTNYPKVTVTTTTDVEFRFGRNEVLDAQIEAS
jgi:hypothetical protein